MFLLSLLLFLLILTIILARKIHPHLSGLSGHNSKNSGRRKEKEAAHEQGSALLQELNARPLSLNSLQPVREALFSSDFDTAYAALLRLQEEGKAILYMNLISRKKPLRMPPAVLQNILNMLARSDGEEFFRWLLKDYHKIRIPRVIEGAIKATRLVPGPGSRQFLFKVIDDTYTPYHLPAIRHLAYCGDTGDIARLNTLRSQQGQYKKAMGATITAIRKRLRAQSSGWLSQTEKNSDRGSLTVTT